MVGSVLLTVRGVAGIKFAVKFFTCFLFVFFFDVNVCRCYLSFYFGRFS